MQDFSYLNKTASDWKITSYGDLGAFAGVGGRISHQKFYSSALKKGVNTIFMEVGGGGGFSAGGFDKIIAQINNLVKATESATAEAGYKDLLCHRAFAIADIIGALGDSESGQLTLAGGVKTLRICARGNGSGPSGTALLFTLPMALDKSISIGAEASVSAGVFLGVGTQFYNYNMQQRFQRELNRKPTDPVIRDPGGF